ncbi:hypothetical protein FXO09_10165 [Microcystis aeruginosa KLA2]|nr:MAG: hypothetical protein EWV62_14040 [Microcystis aeruginosa Ma_OC_LR_19540900_S633]TYT71379.1 hypothetical protein FXO09_10165 [Microcystis aeruginosa KLA2]
MRNSRLIHLFAPLILSKTARTFSLIAMVFDPNFYPYPSQRRLIFSPRAAVTTSQSLAPDVLNIFKNNT